MPDSHCADIAARVANLVRKSAVKSKIGQPSASELARRTAPNTAAMPVGALQTRAVCDIPTGAQGATESVTATSVSLQTLLKISDFVHCLSAEQYAYFKNHNLDLPHSLDIEFSGMLRGTEGLKEQYHAIVLELHGVTACMPATPSSMSQSVVAPDPLSEKPTALPVPAAPLSDTNLVPRPMTTKKTIKRVTVDPTQLEHASTFTISLENNELAHFAANARQPLSLDKHYIADHVITFVIPPQLVEYMADIKQATDGGVKIKKIDPYNILAYGLHLVAHREDLKHRATLASKKISARQLVLFKVSYVCPGIVGHCEIRGGFGRDFEAYKLSVDEQESGNSKPAKHRPDSFYCRYGGGMCETRIGFIVMHEHFTTSPSNPNTLHATSCIVVYMSGKPHPLPEGDHRISLPPSTAAAKKYTIVKPGGDRRVLDDELAICANDLGVPVPDRNNKAFYGALCRGKARGRKLVLAGQASLVQFSPAPPASAISLDENIADFLASEIALSLVSFVDPPAGIFVLIDPYQAAFFACNAASSVVGIDSCHRHKCTGDRPLTFLALRRPEDFRSIPIAAMLSPQIDTETYTKFLQSVRLAVMQIIVFSVNHKQLHDYFGCGRTKQLFEASQALTVRLGKSMLMYKDVQDSTIFLDSTLIFVDLLLRAFNEQLTSPYPTAAHSSPWHERSTGAACLYH
ncbi:hypothetical protein BC828DRAFT_53489 [Blastocladiella britannica]|nr:hypothetical protein BC828DRAFT_53489 [Blastocladiella britannica]